MASAGAVTGGAAGRMMSRAAVKQVLGGRVGRFVPGETHPPLVAAPFVAGDGDGVRVCPVGAGDEAAHWAVKAFMLANFFKEAPIPRALRLLEATASSTQMARFLNREMDMYLKSGSCLLFSTPVVQHGQPGRGLLGHLAREASSKDAAAAVQAIAQRVVDTSVSDEEKLVFNAAGERVVGSAMVAVWERNPDYQVIPATAEQWHNAAAELAHELQSEAPPSPSSPSSPPPPQVVWRDLQFQHLYNVAQQALQQRPCERLAWLGCLAYERSVRNLGITVSMFNHLFQSGGMDGMAIGTQSNFRAFDPFVEKFQNVQLMDEVKYVDEELLVGGERVFDTLKPIHGIRFYVGFH